MQLQLGKMLELNDSALLDLVNTNVAENPALEFSMKETSQEVSALEHGTAQAKDSMAGLYNDGLSIRNNNYNDILITNYSSRIQDETLYEHLKQQLNDLILDSRVYELTDFLIGNIDSKGYFANKQDAIIDDYIIFTGIEPDKKEIDLAFKTVRSLEPSGVGAFDLADCLKIQLRQSGASVHTKKDALNIIDNELDSFLKKNFKTVKGKLLLDDSRFNEAEKLIKSLDPYPGRSFPSGHDSEGEYITPDFIVMPDIDNPGALQISLNSNIPEIGLEPSFQELHQKETIEDSNPTSRKKATALYLKERSDSAKNFIQLLKMRQNTLMRIINAIAKIQSVFFMSGDKIDLKPMALKDIASITGDDLSVISRATSGRYVLTTGGLFPLKTLFSGQKGGEANDELTGLHIETFIKEIIENEDPHHPFADESIASMLNEKGIVIARRTVAKYRENMNIPNARYRRR